ncbi:MAG: protease modulator HflC [Spirochaetaceae bacterium]|jgi:membrane protease subunit HflC|nr:protease modulator HflC [Spirochaetaceae bacterium]
MKRVLLILGAIVALLIVFLMMGPLYVIDEGTQVVVTRFGEIVNAHSDAGLHFKVPFIDIVTTYPKLILSLDGDSQRIPTKENQFIIVDTTSRWRISDPALFYRALKRIETANNRLSDIIDSAVRTVITQNRMSEIVRSTNNINMRNSTETLALANEEDSAQIEEFISVASASEDIQRGRRQLIDEMADIARQMVPEYGIELIDVVPRQIKYSDEVTETVYSRMIKERNQVAQAYRSLGEGKKAKWLGSMENEKRTILSDAYRQAEEIKGAADAEASRIYAESYSKDAEFYAFWKSLESYKETLPGFDAAFSTDMDYFQYLYSSRRR